MKEGQKGRVVFYDITTETDEAGNPIKKTMFEFPFQYNPKYVKYNEVTKDWELAQVPSKKELIKTESKKLPKKKQIPSYLP